MTTFNRRTAVAGLGSIVFAGLAGCLGDDDDDDDDDDGNGADDPESRAEAFLSDNDASGFDGSFEDLTGEDEITIAVGAGSGGTAFDPAAARIDTGTTVVWEWTGDGGGHNVVPDGDTDFDDFGDSSTTAQEGHTAEYTFDESGAALYVCTPHRAQDMYGALIVE